MLALRALNDLVKSIVTMEILCSRLYQKQAQRELDSATMATSKWHVTMNPNVNLVTTTVPTLHLTTEFRD
jgi:hypothetical protein